MVRLIVALIAYAFLLYELDSINRKIGHINRKVGLIMAAIDDLNAKVDELQKALDDEQSQILKAISDLEQEVKDLEAIIASGGSGTSDAEIQAVIDKIDATIADLKSTIPDAEPKPTPQSQSKR
jgi:chromosome segregation ATPase